MVTIKQTVAMLACASLCALTACSSGPSPWAKQSSSPWAQQDSQEETTTQNEPAMDDSMPMESTAEADGMQEPVDPYAPVEPVDPYAPVEPMEPAAMAEDMPSAEQSGMAAEPEPAPAMESAEMAPAAPMAVAGGSLSEQPDNYYAVQVVASSSMENLQAFADSNGFSTAWVAETSVGGKNWYVLMEGVYATKEEANQSLANIEARLNTGPWVRTVGSVKAVMVQ